jgi:branched-chain amino acid transport system substrate-binding protein
VVLCDATNVYIFSLLLSSNKPEREGGIKMKKIMLLSMMIILAIFLTACQNSITGEVIKEQNMIKAGVITPLTGDMGIYGQDIRKGLELAKEDIYKETGREIELIYEDSCLPKETLTSTNKLINIDEINFITGGFCAIGVPVINTVTNPKKITNIIAASTADTAFNDGEYLFSTSLTAREEAYAQAEFVFKELNAETASIVYLNTDFGATYNNYFTKRFEELGGKIIDSEEVDIFSNDYKTTLTKIKANEPEALLVIHVGNQLAVLLKQIKELGIDSNLLGNYESEDINILSSAGKAAEGYMFSTTQTKEQTKTQKDFEKRFEEKYSEKPDFLAKSAYDGLMLQAKAYIDCDGEKECIKEKLLEVKDYKGASGDFSIGEDGTAIKQVNFKIVKDGKFVFY